MNNYQRTCLKHARALRKRAESAGNDNLTVLLGTLNEIAEDLEQSAKHDSPTWREDRAKSEREGL